jgi:glycine/D-amino acid oxidase-like deaminating enzyme
MMAPAAARIVAAQITGKQPPVDLGISAARLGASRLQR